MSPVFHMSHPSVAQDAEPHRRLAHERAPLRITSERNGSAVIIQWAARSTPAPRTSGTI